MPGPSSKIGRALLDPENAFSIAGAARELKAGPGNEGMTPKLIFTLFRYIFFAGAVIGFFSLASRMAAGKLNAQPVHYGLEYIGFAGIVALPLAFENKQLYQKQKESHKALLKANYAELHAKAVSGGASYGPLTKIAAYNVRAEVALIAFKMLLLSGFFVAGGLGMAKIVSMTQVGIMGLAIGVGYYFGTYFFRAGINYSQMKAMETIEKEQHNKNQMLYYGI